MSDGSRLLLDEMLSGEIAFLLRHRGWDVVAVVEDPALIGTSDEDLLAHATSEGRAIVTANIGDFAAISTRRRSQGRDLQGREHCGLAYITSRHFPQDRSYVGAIVGALHKLLESDMVPPAGAETYLRRPES